MPHPIEHLQPRSLKYLTHQLTALIEGRLWLKVLLSLFLGLGVGLMLGPSTGWVQPETAASAARWLSVPGRLFLSLVQMIVVPLIFASIIRGLAASEDLTQLKRVGLRLGLYFTMTTFVAIVIAVLLAQAIEPGQFLDSSEVRKAFGGSALAIGEALQGQGSGEALSESLLSLVPSNPLSAMVNLQMLQVVLFALILGVALVSIQETQSKPLLDLLGSLQSVSMEIVRWTMKMAPLAVFGLMAKLTASLGVEVLLGMLVYVVTVWLGLALVLGLDVCIAAVMGRLRPMGFLRHVRQAQMLAFSTSSSAAVMPLSLKTAEEALGVRPSIAQFAIPLGATLNMNATAVYQGVATLFLVQVFAVELSTLDAILLVFTAVVASLGSPSTPGVCIVLLSWVLQPAGVPLEGLGLIIAVDRLLDMSRSAVNVTGDIAASVVMERLVPERASAEEQRDLQEVHEAERAHSGADVLIIRPAPQGGNTHERESPPKESS